jgi:hypothetical protein
MPTLHSRGTQRERSSTGVEDTSFGVAYGGLGITWEVAVVGGVSVADEDEDEVTDGVVWWAGSPVELSSRIGS